MATAPLTRTASRGPRSSERPSVAEVTADPDQRHRHRCPCGHVLRVFGGGRHRVYFELGDAELADPVMNRVCPACGRGLPGKNAQRPLARTQP